MTENDRTVQLLKETVGDLVFQVANLQAKNEQLQSELSAVNRESQRDELSRPHLKQA